MTFVVADRVKESVIVGGNGDVQLGGGVAGFQTFSSVMLVADTTWYAIIDLITLDWEVGLGTFIASNRLKRTSVLSSSSGGSKISFQGNRCDVFQDVPASFILNPRAAIPVKDLGEVSGVLHIDATVFQVFRVVLVGPVTDFQLFTGAGLGIYQSVTIWFIQGGTGSNDVAFPDNFFWQGNYSASLQTRVGARDILQAVTIEGGEPWITAIALQAAPSP